MSDLQTAQHVPIHCIPTVCLALSCRVRKKHSKPKLTTNDMELTQANDNMTSYSNIILYNMKHILRSFQIDRTIP